MKAMAYCVYREDEFFVAQCLDVDVSSFGATRQEAVANLKEAVELYVVGESGNAYNGFGRDLRVVHPSWTEIEIEPEPLLNSKQRR